MSAAIDIFLHLDRYLGSVVEQYGAWIYLILFLVIFMETGLVVTPFLPGDSLLFAAGALAATGSFNAHLLAALLIAAGVLGNTTNYLIGRYFGGRIRFTDDARVLKRKYIERTQHFFERFGAAAVVLSRFAPIIRTFTPFLAGLGRMHLAKFTLYNILGAASWIVLFIYGGYFFGNIPVVKKNFSVVILIIIIVSLLPGAYEFYRQRKLAKAESKE